MDLFLKISGNEKENYEEVIIEKDYLEELDFKFDSPDDTANKSNEITTTLKIKGKIDENTIVATKILAEWINSDNSSKEFVYRNVEVLAKIGKQVQRKYTLTSAFIVDYQEILRSKDSEFFLFLKQKHDKIKEIEIDGNYEDIEEE